MKLATTLGASALLVLMLGAFATASANTCKLTDVTLDEENALACAGHFTSPEPTLSNLQVQLNGFAESSWTGVAPDPLAGWLIGGKWDVAFPEGGTPALQPGGFEGGVLTEGALVDFGNGTFEINITPWAEVVIVFKQSTGHAFYYFQNGGEGTYNLSWVSFLTGDPQADEFSNINLFVRGEVPVPEPAALGLLGLGLIGLAMVRRRRLN